MNLTPPRIPRLLAVLLDRIEPESLLGDLVEEYVEIIRPERGPVRARFWFWTHLFRSVLVGTFLTRFARPAHELARDRRPRKTPGEYMTSFINDVRFGVRMIWKAPLTSVTVIVGIALGVGITTHTFSIVYGAAMRGLPYDGAERLMHIERALPSEGVSSLGVPIHDYLDWRGQQDVFEGLAAYYQQTVNLAGAEAEPERYAGAFVTWNVFEQVGPEPILGRVFRQGEDLPGAPLTIVLGYDVWQTRYGGDEDIVGKTVRANGLTATVIGVMPPNYRFPFDEDLWLPLDVDAAQLARGEGLYLEVIGRLRQGRTRDEAWIQMNAIADRLAATYPEVNEGITAIVKPYVDEYMPEEIVQTLYLMLLAVFGVLLIACANVANLFMARAAARAREVAVRTALGAKRMTIVRQLLIESGILAFVGGLLGVLASHVGTRAFIAWVADIEKPFWIDMGIDTTVLIFALVVTVAAGLVSGTIPALKASGANINDILKDENRGSSGFRVGKFSTFLVISEIAVSCALLVGAGMMVKSIASLRTFDLGFETDHQFTARIDLFETEYPESEDRIQFYDRLIPRLEAVPGVEQVALAAWLPGAGADDTRFGVEGESYAQDSDYPIVNYNYVTPSYFDVFGTRIVEGKDFTFADRRDAPRVVIVNQSFARRFFSGTSAVGRRIRFGTSQSAEQPWRSIVGVVSDMWIGDGNGGFNFSTTGPEQVFIPMHQAGLGFVAIALRTTGAPLAVTRDVRQAVVSLDPDLPIFDVQPMDKILDRSTWAFRVFGALFSLFGIASLVMVAVGLYGVMAFTVTSRTKEMGIRMAMGALGNDIVRLVLRQGLKQLAIGLVIGLGLGFALSRALSQFLLRIDPGDLLVYAAIVSTLIAAGVLACLIPARRATTVNVVNALRPE